MFSPPPERHKKGSLVKGRCAAAVNAYTVPMFSLPILLGNDTGRVREVTNRRKPPCEIVSGHCPQGSLAKGSWHAGGVTEGASGVKAGCLRMGWYLLVVIDTQLQLFGLFSNQPSASACQRGLTFLPRQERKQRSRLKGGATRSRSNCSPLKNPPGGTIGRLTLRFGSGWWVLASAPVSGRGFWGALFPRCRLKARKSPVSHNKTIPGAKRLPCQRELAKIFDF